MKKFFGFGKGKKDAGSGATAGKGKGSNQASSGVAGYDLKEKDLSKLHKAAWFGDLEKVKQLAKKDASVLDKANRTPLHLACVKGHSTVVQELLEWKAKLNLGDNDARTPLMKAIQCHQEECARLLLEDKADPNTKDLNGEACLHYAARDGLINLLDLLLQVDRTNIDIQNKRGQTALHLTILTHQPDVCRFLLDEGADFNVQDQIEGRTPLMYACQEGDVDLTRMLLHRGADTKIKDGKGWTADDIAIMASQDACREAISNFVAGGRQSRGGETMTPPDTAHSVDTTYSTHSIEPPPEFGAPALDAPEEFSGADETPSKISEAGGGVDSWADSDEESELDFKKKKIPGLDLSKILKNSNEDVSKASEGKPSNVKLAKTNQVQRTESNTSGGSTGRSKPAAAKDSGGPPVSARSVLSAKSSLSFGGDDNTWSDNDSLFSSARDAKDAKPSLAKGQVGVKKQISENDEISWSDNESLPIASGREEKGKPGDSKILNTGVQPQKAAARKGRVVGKMADDFSDFDSDEEEMEQKDKGPPGGTGSALDNNAKKGIGLKDMTEDRKKETEKKGAIMAELGISDVSDVSDPDDLSDPSPGFSVPGTKAKVKAKPSGGDSDWDSTVGSAINTPRTAKQTPASARSGQSGWDSDEEGAEAAPPTKAKTMKDAPTAVKNKQDEGWDSDVDEPILPDAKAPSRPQADSKVKKEQNQAAKTSPAVRSLLSRKDSAGDDDDSKWDSDDELPLSGGLPKAAPTVAKSEPIAKSTPRTESEEEESEWEKEKRLNQEKLKRQKSEEEAERRRKWEEEFNKRQEQLKREAQEELRKEQEDLERQRKEEEEALEAQRKKREREERERQEAQERERKAREEQARLERELQEKERQERERKEKERERQERERIEREKKEMERLEREKQEQDRREAERKERERKAAEDKRLSNLHQRNNLTAVPQLSDDEEDRSQQLRIQREKAERELEEARARQKANLGHHSFDDEDTFNDADDLDLPRENGVKHDHTPGMLGGTGPPGGTMQHTDDDLSYSSTEAEGSLHENVPATTLTGGLNFTLGNDSANVMRMQEQVRDAKRLVDKERSARISLENKKKNLEKERVEFLSKLENVTRAKSNLEQIKIDLEAKIRSMEYRYNEEVEKRKNSEVLYSKTKEQLTRKEQQYTQEIEAKQKSELALRNIQMELRAALAQAKQLEEEKDDVQRQLSHEKNARQLQEQINDEQLKLQHALQGQPDSAGTEAEVISRLEAADENRKLALDTVDKMKAEVYALKMELDRQRARHKDEHSMLTAENEDLHGKVDDLKADIKLNEEALAHATMQYNVQLSTLKTEVTMLMSNLEKEKGGRDKLETELQSLTSRLQATSLELEKAQQARNDLERNSHKEHEEWNNRVERRDQELNALKETNQNISHRLGAAEAKVTAVENELHIASATLLERTNQLSTIQRDLDQRRMTQDTIEQNLRKEKEENARLEAKMETLQEKLTNMQHDTLSLRQQLEEARSKDSIKDRAAFDSHDKFQAMLASLNSDHEKARAALEQKNVSLNETISQLKDELRNVNSRGSNREHEQRQLQQELTETTKRLTMTEASLELAGRAKSQIENEKASVRAEMDKLQNKLERTKEKQLQAEARVAELMDRLERAEQNTVAASQQLASQSANAEAFSKSKAELEDIVHQLELEKARLEAALKHEVSKNEMLQRDLNDSNQVRNTMEALLSNLKSSNAHMEEKLHEAAATSTIATQEAEDTRNLWESEVKSRSKLGLRISQLERLRQEALSQADEEKKKTRKAMELKKLAETKLEAETEKSNKLNNDMATLKVHLKAAKKRLKELDTSEHRVNILHADFDKERLNMDSALSTVRKQLEDCQQQLQSETSQKEKLEAQTRQLQQELHSLRHMEKTYTKLEKAKRKLEDEFALYKAHIKNNLIEKSELDRLKTELEAKSRIEVNQKLEEVNTYLEEQAQARQKLDKMRDSNEAELRREFDKTKAELVSELTKLRGNLQAAQSNQEVRTTELGRMKELLDSEVQLRERLAERLKKANDKAASSTTQQLLEQQRMRYASSGGTVEGGWLANGSAAFPGKSASGQVHDLLNNKIKAELDRSIAKHLEKAPHIDISPAARSMDDSYLRSSFNQSSNDYLSVLKKNYFV